MLPWTLESLAEDAHFAAGVFIGILRFWKRFLSFFRFTWF